jgi:predicted CXXCH cytochrome family protein
MLRPLEDRSDRRVKGDLSLGLVGLFAALTGLCLLLLLLGTSTVTAQQASRGTPGLATATATATPTTTPTTVTTPTVTTTPTVMHTVTTTLTTTQIITPTPTTTQIITPTPTTTHTVTPTPTATQIVTPTATPMSGGLPPVFSGIRAIEELWGVDQICTASLTDGANSIDLAFNDATASCGPFVDGSTWTYIDVQDTTLLTVERATLEVRFYVTGWANDPLGIEIWDGAAWQVVALLSTASPPPATLTTLAYDVSAVLTTRDEANGAQVRFVGGQQASPDGHLLHLDEVRLEISDDVQTPTPLPTLGPVPTPTAPVPAATDLPGDGDPHVDYAATTASCAGCHRAHTAGGLALRAAWPEESLCFACHAAGGPGTDVEAAFGQANTVSAIFKHDVAGTSGVHRVGEAQGSDLGGANRHVECEDCHEPHEATRGPAGAPMLQREMNDVSGVDPLWTAAGAPAGYTWLDRAEREYQVCFKCHASFTTLPAYLPDGWDGSSIVADGLRKLTASDPEQVPDSRDLAQEFNPYNASFHPVAAQGRNQSVAAGAFVAGWSSTSLVYCSDCHSNPDPAAGGSGPHGSPLLHILTGQADYQTADADAPAMTGSEVCFACHDAADYTGNGSDSNFRRVNRNLHSQHGDNAACYLCHDSHGSEQRHLLNLDLSIGASSNTYLLPGYDGQPTDSQTFWQISPDGSEKTCWLVCHGHNHSGSSYANVSD